MISDEELDSLEQDARNKYESGLGRSDQMRVISEIRRLRELVKMSADACESFGYRLGKSSENYPRLKPFYEEDGGNLLDGESIAKHLRWSLGIK